MSNRKSARVPSKTPVNLPLADIHVDERGAMRATLDGRVFQAPGAEAEWSRARFGELLDAISEHRTRTVRVEIHEFDGSVFTEIVNALRNERATAEAAPPSAMRRARHRPMHQLFEITASGFIPGEDITVALSVSNAEGSADGSARGLVDLSQLVDHRSEIMLIGRVSGVIVSERLPS
ncbi:hypothetical protein JOF28_001588 [Leucobacter exalbidus]|uniref:Uncharacterized protein n=1 Tax=Leucobacter exalbidus TaxID=662960 RepID=A0A940T5V7_9MICO|nr:hypothetical protein [Leucobacter exalbidus]MBP1326356.1 hypothetical protein [Leucobacter exalbidus]